MTLSIKTNNDLAILVMELLRDSPDFAELYYFYLTRPPEEIDRLFWVYELEDQEGKKEWWLDYQLQNGGGWLTIGMPCEKFISTLNVMLTNWKLPRNIKKDLRVRKQYLMSYLNRVTSEEIIEAITKTPSNKTKKP